MKISYVNSLCVRHDAISNAIRDEIGFFRQAGETDIRLFAFRCDHSEIPFTACQHLGDVAAHPHFQQSDLVVFHFGIYHALFDLFPVVPIDARKLVVFHNITPASLVPPKDRGLIEKSMRQIANIGWADRAICVSATNMKALRAQGVDTPVSIVPLAVHSNLVPPPDKPSFADGIARILFLGRFTRAKGPDELITAVESLLRDSEPAFRIQLDFVGNLAFSDAAMVSKLRSRIEQLHRGHGGRLEARIHGDAPEEVKHALLRNADILALPTYHEGFCVPIVEAIASGCRIVVYDNSNTADITDHFGTLVPTGDVAGFAAALRSSIDLTQSPGWRNGQGEGSYAEHAAQGAQYSQRFSPEHVAPAFMQAISHVMAPRP